ncbi:N-lysine methyltransferase KMT5A-like isoform X2 [Saccostrea echinata]|uniref:N-lysine methyltransferase KMT5A-like isoform X2 n=1 Tax=Saccostrea echinata TaxID=191078 RepID=UPI002A840F51|nr:N-lysine methyltransferase KMT5A-like isoform X2 [Saccostrea echinata]
MFCVSIPFFVLHCVWISYWFFCVFSWILLCVEKKMAGNRELRSKQMKSNVIPFDIAKQDALDYIHRCKDKPGCIVKKVDSLIGKGLYAGKEFQQGEFILEYAGDLISRKKGLAREKTYPSHKGSYIYFFTWDSKRYCLDATNSSRKCRFANDAGPRDDRQNAVMKCIPVSGTPHLGLFAAMKIGIGVEIRYDYSVKDLPWRRQIENCVQEKEEISDRERVSSLTYILLSKDEF